MRIAIFGKNTDECPGFIKSLFYEFTKRGYEIFIHRYFYDENQSYKGIFSGKMIFEGYDDMPEGLNFAFSIGGDGTFLKSVAEIRDSGVPVIGINTGRLGFLSNVNFNDFRDVLESMEAEDFVLSKRSLIQLIDSDGGPAGYTCALNDICVQKKGFAIITINVSVNNEFLNTYWADGLIFATPTGSTAYNLSVGGPIVAPDSDNILVVSPIAAHNLNVRPLVISGIKEIEIRVESRDGVFLVSTDNNNFELDINKTLKIKPAGFKINTVMFKGTGFYNTLRSKFMWGIDKRN